MKGMDTSSYLSVCGFGIFLRFSNLFSVLHVFSDPSVKELSKGQWACSSRQHPWNVDFPVPLSIFPLTLVSFLFSPLCFPVFPCLPFQRPECVAASQLTVFLLGDKNEEKGLPQEGRGVGKEVMGHIVWGGMGVRALTICGAPNFKAIFAKQEPKHCS